jgi:hypothetical protein
MEEEQEKKYQTLNISDHIRAISEMEHIYSHSIRSKQVTEGTEDEVFYQTIANKAKALRRKYMKTYFPDCPDELWCLGKASASLRQVVYEADEGHTELVKEADDLVDEIWGRITKEDLWGCQSCKSDRQE